eukprot:scaffold1307_cov200-Pinguiococcus_pyrenoidosus.AAC.43
MGQLKAAVLFVAKRITICLARALHALSPEALHHLVLDASLVIFLPEAPVHEGVALLAGLVLVEESLLATSGRLLARCGHISLRALHAPVQHAEALARVAEHAEWRRGRSRFARSLATLGCAPLCGSLLLAFAHCVAGNAAQHILSDTGERAASL